MNAWRSLSRFRGDAPFRPWLLRIVANQTRNTVRSRQRRRALALRSLHLRDPVDPAVIAETDERDSAVLAAVRSLRPGQRDVVVCRWFLGMSEAETAAALGIAPGTAKSRASRALRSLRAALADPEVSDARG